MNITRNLTPYNHSAGRYLNGVPQGVSIIVLHTMVGSIDSAEARFMSPNGGASANYGVALSGSIRQWVSEGDTAWQAGNWPVNTQSIGIEHEDLGNYNDAVRTDALYESSIELVTDICRRYGLDSTNIHVHNEFKATACPDGLDVARIRNGVAARLAGASSAPAPALPANAAPSVGTAKVTVSTLLVRNAPRTHDSVAGRANTPDGALHAGTVVGYTGYVLGEYVAGNPIWLVSVRGNYFWSGGTNFNWQAVMPAPAIEPAPEATTAPVTPPTPEVAQPTPQAVPDVPMAPSEPDWHITTPAINKSVALQDYTVKDLDGKGADVELKAGMIVNQVAVFTKEGIQYALTDKSIEAGVYYGIPVAILTDYVEPAAIPTPTGGISADILPGKPVEASDFDGVPDWANFKKNLSARDRIIATIAAFESVVLAIGHKLNPFKKGN